MSDKRQLEFFLLRYVPDVVKGEFVNIGVVMLEPEMNGSGFADVRFTKDWRRVLCLDPEADVEVLRALEQEVRRQVQEAGDRKALLKNFQDSFANLIQVSPTAACLAEEPAHEIENIAKLYLERRRGTVGTASGRQRIVRGMQDAFEAANVLELMMRGIAVEKYTKPGDPMKIDFGYRVGQELKMFHAVSLKTSLDQAINLAFRYPKIAEGARRDGVSALLTAVVDDDLNRADGDVLFAIGALEESRVEVASVGEMPQIAERARVELSHRG